MSDIERIAAKLSKNIVIYGVMFLLIYTVMTWWRQPVMPAYPKLELNDIQGRVVDVDALSHDRPVLVYFWGSWCSVCSVTSPMVDRLDQRSPYPVISIAVQSGNASELTSYMQKNDLSFTTINDEDGTIFADWRGQVTPSYVILKKGEMTQGLTGIQTLWSLRLRLWLASVV